MAIRTIQFTVTENLDITPKKPLDAGVQGDDNATVLEFSLPPILCEGYNLYIEYIDGASAYDRSDTLAVFDNKVSLPLPLAWTQNGGKATVRLVASKLMGDAEIETAYTFEGKIRFSGRQTALSAVGSIIKGCIESLLSKCKAEADRAAASANQISDAIEDAHDAADTARGAASGVVFIEQNTGSPMKMWVGTEEEYQQEQPITNTLAFTTGSALDYYYPPGTIYHSIRETHPAVLFGGGVWERIYGRFLLGAGEPEDNTSDVFGTNLTKDGVSKYNETVGTLGGESLHTMSKAEMPSHNHSLHYRTNAIVGNYYTDIPLTAPNSGEVLTSALSVDDAGNDKPHNNMPPFYVVYMWVRIA